MTKMQTLIPRPDYLAKLERHTEQTDLIKIVTGVRRCGKSTLFDIYTEKLKSNGITDDQILVIKLENLDNKALRDGMALHKFVKEYAEKAEKLVYVFLDEVQLVSDFADVINSLRLRDNLDLYVTGSNAQILPHNLPKILSGRYIQIHMFPLSFKEYGEAYYKKIHRNPTPHLGWDMIFQFYLEHSSFPEALTYVYPNPFPVGFGMTLQGGLAELIETRWDGGAIREYLDNIYNSILTRDIMTHEGVKELPQLTRVINFMFSNIGSETSINNMKNVINDELKSGKTFYAPMLETYLQALLDSFLFYKAEVQRFGKKMLRPKAKYYAVDMGLRYHLLGGAPNKDAGHVLENIVYLELLRRGYNKVEVGKIETKTGDIEIDFVAQKEGGKTEYYQVAQSVMDETTLARELASLEAIKDHHPKFILTRDTNNNDYGGIQHLNVLKWLLDIE
ncbi:MAG: ATP-binding protein [Alphaproteobacteria bacterium]|nr:ATP-binding protein [Alphaproteobacteria bacterium]